MKDKGEDQDVVFTVLVQCRRDHWVLDAFEDHLYYLLLVQLNGLSDIVRDVLLSFYFQEVWHYHIVRTEEILKVSLFLLVRLFYFVFQIT